MSREEPNVKNSAASDSGSDWGEPNNKNDQNEWDKSEKWGITKGNDSHCRSSCYSF